jgi:hypothetical protein
MKNILFGQFPLIFSVLLLLTHSLIRIGRYGFLTRNNIGFLLPAALSSVATVILMAWYGLSTHWWNAICLFNLSILLLIAIDLAVGELGRSFRGDAK